MDVGKRFDKVAKEYDTPEKLERSEKIVNFLKENLPLSKNWKVLDFGCGTGTTDLLIHPFVGSITGVDLSQGMINVFKEKLKNLNIKNIKIERINILEESFDEKDFDLIITAMTFHHLENPKYAVEKLSNYLKNDGYVSIVDLEKEDGTFHSDNTDVKHFGFSDDEIKSWFKNSNFEILKKETVYKISKERNGKIKKYPVFIVIAKKVGEF